MDAFQRLSAKRASQPRRRKRPKNCKETAETYAKVFMMTTGVVRLLLKDGPSARGRKNTKLRRALTALLFKADFDCAPHPNQDVTAYIKTLDKWFDLLHCPRKTGKGPHKRIYSDEGLSQFYLQRKSSETRDHEYDSGSQWALSIRWVKHHLNVSL
jgi:hypothetical protein